MDNQQIIPPFPRPDFEAMTSKSLIAYLKKNQAFMRDNDRVGTPADALLTATRVANRKAEGYLDAREEAAELDRAMAAATQALAKFPKGAMGLTPDEVKRTPEWQAAFQESNRALQAIRKFNATYTKTFADELRHERQFRRAAGMKAC
jgi:hypothetical protein